jgi:hypothetical protein
MTALTMGIGQDQANGHKNGQPVNGPTHDGANGAMIADVPAISR